MGISGVEKLVAGKYGVVLWQEWLIDGIQEATGTLGPLLWTDMSIEISYVDLRLFWQSRLILSFVYFF